MNRIQTIFTFLVLIISLQCSYLEKDRNMLNENDIKQMTDAFQRTYAVELLFIEAPKFDTAQILKSGKEHLDNTRIYITENDNNFIIFSHLNNLVEYSDGKFPVQCLLIKSNKMFDYSTNDKYTEYFQQSWSWPGS